MDYLNLIQEIIKTPPAVGGKKEKRKYKITRELIINKIKNKKL